MNLANQEPEPSAPPEPVAQAALALRRALSTPADQQASVGDIAKGISAIFKLSHAERLDLIDLAAISPDAVHPAHLISSLRATFSFRDKVPSWRPGLLIAIDACALRGIDARQVLSGLL
jgi:hypothetical protein